MARISSPHKTKGVKFCDIRPIYLGMWQPKDCAVSSLLDTEPIKPNVL